MGRHLRPWAAKLRQDDASVLRQAAPGCINSVYPRPDGIEDRIQGEDVTCDHAEITRAHALLSRC